MKNREANEHRTRKPTLSLRSELLRQFDKLSVEYAADLKADECGCNVVMKRYSNPFHRPYYKVSRCEFHETAAAEHRELRAQLKARDSELKALKEKYEK